MHGRTACMAGHVHGRTRAWQERVHGRNACMAGTRAWQDTCMAGTRAWQERVHGRNTCMAGTRANFDPLLEIAKFINKCYFYSTLVRLTLRKLSANLTVTSSKIRYIYSGNSSTE